MQAHDDEPLDDAGVHTGILGRPAPELGVTHWVDAAGQPLHGHGLQAMHGAFKLIFCFQHACPGCHLSGFPQLAQMVDTFRGSRWLGIVAVQTVFEEFDLNTCDNMRADQLRYALPIAFGHDAGEGRSGAGSVLMQRYRSGGTPWFILIDPAGIVAYNHFNIDAPRLIAQLRRSEKEASMSDPPDEHTLTWQGVMKIAQQGNPPPPRRVQRSDAEWREQLTQEQYRITRQQGTERAHSSGMCALFEPGIYGCVCCGTALFDSSSKFASKSGWPSFTQPLASDVVAYHGDSSHGMSRVETTCNVCDAHLGHVFPDGPPPSGLRYCMNAEALVKR